MKIRCFLLTMAIAATSLFGAIAKLDWNQEFQVIDGFGASLAYTAVDPKWYSLLFSPDSGIGLTIIRCRVHTSKEQWGMELDAMKAAMRHGAILYSVPWSPPAIWKTNNSLNNGGYLKPENYGDYANYLADYVLHYESQGVPIYAVAVQNEPDLDPSYASCLYSAENHITFVKDHMKPAFTAKGVMAKIIADEYHGWEANNINQILADSSARAAIDIVSAHAYAPMEPQPFPLVSGVYKKHLWMTETSTAQNDPGINDGLFWANLLNQYMVVAQANAWLYWWLYTRGTSGEGLIGGEGSVDLPNKRLYTIGNFSKFIRPGFLRIELTNSPAPNLVLSAYKSPNNLVIVAVNSGQSDISLDIELKNTPPAASMDIWRTSATEDLVKVGTVAASRDTLKTTIQARSVMTFSSLPQATNAGVRSMPHPNMNARVRPAYSTNHSDLAVRLADIRGRSLRQISAGPDGYSRAQARGVYLLKNSEKRVQLMILIP